MKNNAFAQVHRAFYSLITPNKNTPTRRASAWWERSERNVPTLFHSDPQRGRQAVEHLHQAVERRHALPQAEGRHRAAYPRRSEEAP